MTNYNFVLEVVGVIRASLIVSKKTFGKSLSFQIAKKFGFLKLFSTYSQKLV